jgi:hypothetical protein
MNTTTVTNATEYRDLPLVMLTESTTNPRRIFEENALKELAETIRSQGVLSPLLVRPTSERSFEIVFGARRYRAAQLAEVATVPVRIKNLTDAEVLEAQLIENLQRRDVHPMEEANGLLQRGLERGCASLLVSNHGMHESGPDRFAEAWSWLELDGGVEITVVVGDIAFRPRHR